MPTCPTCGRAQLQSADGSALCCARSTIAWRCPSCTQVSEGFAFAYGSCPHCGGKLVPRDAGSLDAAAAIEGVRTAFEIELGGRSFYQRAAAETTDTQLRQLFGRFAVMEGEHIEALSRRHHLDVPNPLPQFRLAVAAIFAGVERRPQDPDNLFQIAIALEERASRFFAQRACGAAADSTAQRLYRELAAEELEHAAMLRNALQRWRDGLPAFAPLAADGIAAPATSADPRANAAVRLLAGHDASRAALVCGSERLSYGELRDRVARAAQLLIDRGVTPGERVAIKLCDGFDWVAAVLGAMWAGAVAVPVNPRIPAPEWQYILDEAGFSLILTEPDDVTPTPWHQRTLVVTDFRHGLLASQPAAAHPVDSNAAAFWCHSSGTSGKPKAVVHAHRCAQAIEQVSREGLGITADDRLFASSKLFFAYPQTNSLWAGLKLGATVILDPQWPTAAGVAATLCAQRPTVLLSVPSLYRNLLHQGLAPGVARCGVRLCLSAGEALPPSLRAEWLRQTGLAIVNGYGASETLALVMLDRGDGRGFLPSPGVGIAPLEDAAPGVPTRLCIRAPTVALGYLDRPQAQAEVFRDGAFCPADLFALEPDQGWRFAGREDSLVKIHGRWVNLVDLEEKLSADTPGLLDAAAVLVSDADGVDAVAFFYTADSPAARDALQARAATLPPHQRPLWWHAVDGLPRGPTGKLLRRQLQDLHRSLA